MRPNSFLLSSAILLGIFSLSMPAAARSACDFLTGEERRQCVKAEVQQITEQNREAAARARAERMEEYSARQESVNAKRDSIQAAREQELADKRKESAEAAAAKRKAEAEAIAAMPKAGEASKSQLERIVETDSRGWIMNHFDRGSVNDVRVAEGSEKSGSMTLRGVYTYNGGNHGWVLARLEGGKFSCVQFWDAQGGCRALRTAQQGAQGRALIGAAVQGMMTEGTSGGGSNSNPAFSDTARYDAWRHGN